MAAEALLAENPKPTRDDVVRAISGNVCRCTGYESIIRAILDAAARA
jgi:carbon-monoxide dehydrogenase small subunit